MARNVLLLIRMHRRALSQLIRVTVAVVTVACSGVSPAAPAAVAAIPAPVQSLAAFGIERRATVTIEGDTTVIACTAGSQAAGVRFSDWTWASAGPELAFEYRASAPFTVDVTRSGATAPDVSDSLPVRRYGRRVSLGADSAQARLTVAVRCPMTAGQLRLTRFDRTPASRPAMRGAWWWDAARWRDSADAMLAVAERLKLAAVSVGPPRTTDGGADAAALGTFVAKATARGMGYGFVAGAVAGAILGAALWEPCDAAEIARNPDYCRHTRRESDAVEGAGIMSVAIGIPVGGVVGWFVKTDTWADIPFKPVIAALRRD